MQGAAIKRRLQTRARALGCAALGVTRAAPVADHARYRAWLDRGWAADMAYLTRDAAQRADPRHLLPAARSVIVVAVPYPAPPPATPAPAGPAPAAPAPATPAPAAPSPAAPAPAAPAPPGRLAALFSGQDYHRVVRRILQDLARTLDDRDTAWRAGVDTAPLLERSLAVAAGLGAVGHHTQLLVPGHGARVALGILLTARDLAPDDPFTEDLCGDCRACLQACPTGALRAGQGLDARRCLSYWTTATRAPIPRDLRPRLGHRLYGCDSCQTCCPHDPAGPTDPAPHPDFAGDPDRDLEALHALLGLGRRALARTLAHTALDWLAPTALRRTLCVVLGNHGDPASLAPLAAALADRDPTVRSHAAWALGRLSLPEARTALEAASARETDAAVLQEIHHTLT